jgi:hypothetical protein
MRACFATTLLCSIALLTGCSLSFGDFPFASSDAGAADGGMTGNAATGAGRAGTAGRLGLSGMGGSTGASGRNGGSGTSGSAGTAGRNTGGTGGTGGAGQEAPKPCRVDADCEDAKAYQCVRQLCALRRLPSGVWTSGGGGLTQSAKFVVRVSVGAPQPLGVVKSKAYSVTVGAGAGRP